FGLAHCAANSCTCPSRFHRTPIHTILDERLGIPENKAIKLLISTFFTLLLIDDTRWESMSLDHF
ncbi:MAG: hypothetical protein OSB82_22290, partial [Alphaproteobacteria bacterium]|nr:hypothetical protein [Alphaproteobacteria bacterium]